ncbi:hypothetical protein [Xenorhabdus griffiniae]|uniref:hypothetical protein n=1 Tax=Xenorhabdus griffiniae TaxID=351672 RepID=UPI002359751D|nr:hypothetical protein [Xenorhabdus griffiniae]MDC9606929.1 hypothetical protein [Xenorhabdus griffiniae]
MHCEFINNSEKETTATSYTQNQLIKSRSVIIAGEINQSLAENVMTQLIILQEIITTRIAGGFMFKKLTHLKLAKAINKEVGPWSHLLFIS